MRHAISTRAGGLRLFLGSLLLWSGLLALLLGSVRLARGGVYDVPPPSGNAAQDRVNLQAVADAAVASAPSLVRFGVGTWRPDRPFRVDACRGVTLRGLGPALSRIKGADNNARDVLVAGVNRTPKGKALTPDHLPDAYGILDASAAPAPGKRWGLRSLGDAHIAQAGGPLDQGRYAVQGRGGDWHRAERGLLIECLLDLSRLPATDRRHQLLGMEDAGLPSPFSLSGNQGGLCLAVATRPPGDNLSIPTQQTYWTPPNVVGGPVPARVTLYLDVDKGIFTCWIDDKKPSGAPAYPQVALPGRVLAANELAHAGLLGWGDTAPQCKVPTDTAVYGLRMGGGPCPYDLNNPVLTRVDGGAINDAYRYFRSGADLIALLPLTDAPAEVCASRCLTIMAQNGFGTPNVPTAAYFLDNSANSDIFGGVVDFAIEDMALECSNPTYGDALKLGAAQSIRLQRCELVGGARGWAAFNYGASYPIRGRDLKASGRDCGISLFSPSAAHLTGLTLNESREGRCQLRVIGGSATIDDVFSPHWGTPDWAVYGKRASLTLRDWALDNEATAAGAGSQIADIYCYPTQDAQPTCPIVVDGFSSVAHSPLASAVLLDGPAGTRKAGDEYCTLRVDGLGVHKFSKLRSLVRTTDAAAGIWRDGRVNLGDTTNRTAFEGPALGAATTTGTAGTTPTTGGTNP